MSWISESSWLLSVSKDLTSLIVEEFNVSLGFYAILLRMSLSTRSTSISALSTIYYSNLPKT